MPEPYNGGMSITQFRKDWILEDRQKILMHEHDMIMTCYEERDFPLLVGYYERTADKYQDYPELAELFSKQIPRAKRYSIREGLR